MTNEGPRLILVGTPIGNLGDLSPRAVETLEAADVVACEDTRRTGRLLTGAGISGVRLMAVHEHNEASRAAEIVELIQAGQTVVMVTDAGMPGISDPGERVVTAVVAADIAVQVVPGPAALVAGLVVSGLGTERFVFDGFLPRKGKARRQRLAALVGEQRTIVLYEAPHRMVATIADLANTLGPERRVATARELTKLYENTWRGTLGDAITHFAEVEPRGEFVVIVDGAPASEPASDDVIADALARRRAAGLGAKQAAADVAADLGVSQRRAYEIGLLVQATPQENPPS